MAFHCGCELKLASKFRVQQYSNRLLKKTKKTKANIFGSTSATAGESHSTFSSSPFPSLFPSQTYMPAGHGGRRSLAVAWLCAALSGH